MSNAITINVKQTKALTIDTWYMLQRANELKLVLIGDNLDDLDSYKYLGTVLDKGLTFEKQAKETIRLVNHKLHCLTIIRQFVSSDQCVHLYKSYIQPYFDFSDIFPENTTSRLKTRLVNLQRFCLRSCLPQKKKVLKYNVVPFKTE